MTTWLPRWFALLVSVLTFPPIAAGPDEAEIARLIKQLGDDDFDQREGATKRLEEIGEPALNALHQAETSNDPEVRCRAKDLVAVIENKLYGPELCLTGHTGEVWSVSVSADGKRVLTSSTDKTLRLWDAHTGKCLRVFEGHTARILGEGVSPDGKHVLSGSDDKTVRLWDATTGRQLHETTGHTDGVSGVAFGPDGTAISAGGDRTMRLWDLKTGKQAGVFTGHIALVRSVAYSAQARLAATGGWDSSIRLWNLDTGKEVRKLPGHDSLTSTGTQEESDHGITNIMSARFSPDGKRVLSSSFDGTMRIWDVATGKELKRLTSASLRGAAFSPDGKRIVFGGNFDKTVRVWDAETGKELRKYEGHSSSVIAVAFFPDGKRIVSTSYDGTARVWRAPR